VAFLATVGGVSATSYVSVAEASSYLGDRLFAGAWDNADEQQRQQALTQATAWLDALAWRGTKATVAQRLAHPRKYLPTPEQDPEFREAQRIEILDESVLYYPSNAVARPIQEATCELALALLGETADPSARDASEGITREKVGPLETEYAAPLVRKQGLARFPAVWTRIQPLLRHAQGGTVTRG